MGGGRGFSGDLPFDVALISGSLDSKQMAATGRMKELGG